MRFLMILILLTSVSVSCIASDDNETLITEQGKWKVTRSETFYEQEDSVWSYIGYDEVEKTINNTVTNFVFENDSMEVIMIFHRGEESKKKISS